MENSNFIYEIPQLVSIDVETTGLFPLSGDRICEIALLKIKEGVIIDKFVTLVNPEKEISLSASLINGITNEMVKNTPPFKNIANKVNDFIKNEILLIHNANFDLSFLKIEMKNCGVQFNETKLIDTLEIARNFFNFQSNSLPNLANYLRIEGGKFHRAEADAWTSYKIFCYLFQELKKKGTSLNQILTLTSQIDITLTPQEILPENIIKNLGKGVRVKIKYINRNGEISLREIEPLEIVNEGGRWYLIGFCHLKKEERKFKFDRILDVIENI